MRTFLLGLFSFAVVTPAFAESPDPPLDNARLTVHTLVREDIFAGWRSRNMERLERGEKNIEVLLEQRPKFRADLLAWKGGAKLYRAVLAREAGENDEFKTLYDEAAALFSEAKTLGPKNPGVAAVVGGSYLTFGDRLPEELRADAWQKSYDNYQILWSQQGKLVDRLPEHIRGELLAGLVQSAQRTGRQQEYSEYLDKIIEVLPDTGYSRVALQWKKDPQSAATGNISCKSCHADGRLEARLAAIEGK
jgi:hypothetical protein